LSARGIVIDDDADDAEDDADVLVIFDDEKNPCRIPPQ
jgi:hypothetical protein